MIDPLLLEILRCPDDHSELALAGDDIVARVNDKIRAGSVCAVGGQTVEKPMDGALIRAAGDRMYPIISGIPVMLVDEAIDITQLK